MEETEQSTSLDENDAEKNDCGCAKVRSLILSQLLAASPASLPFATIFHGICCEFEGIERGDVEEILQKLVATGIVVKIGECGFCDRFMVFDPNRRALENMGANG